MAMYWGTSRWSGQEIMEAYSVARQFNQIPPIVEQAEYNMLTREKVELMMPELRTKIGLGCITWSLDSFILQQCRQKSRAGCLKRSFGYENQVSNVLVPQIL